MSRGIGATQRRILTVLAEHESDYGVTATDISELIGASPRQTRTALRSLERRSLVLLTVRYVGWQGVGEYGRLRVRRSDEPEPNVIAEKGDPYPRDPDRYECARRLEFVYGGMPVRGLMAALPERRRQWDRDRAKSMRRLRAALGITRTDPEEEDDA